MFMQVNIVIDSPDEPPREFFDSFEDEDEPPTTIERKPVEKKADAVEESDNKDSGVEKDGQTDTGHPEENNAQPDASEEKKDAEKATENEENDKVKAGESKAPADSKETATTEDEVPSNENLPDPTVDSPQEVPMETGEDGPPDLPPPPPPSETLMSPDEGGDVDLC